MDALRSLLAHPRTVRACQTIVGLLFVWAALAKLGDLPQFVTMLHNFRIVPVVVENLIGLTLPWIELLAGLALILGVRPRSGAVVVAALLAVFTGAVALALARGLDIECGCFGTSDAARVGVQKVLSNLGMLTLALLGAQRGAAGGLRRRSLG